MSYVSDKRTELINYISSKNATENKFYVVESYNGEIFNPDDEYAKTPSLYIGYGDTRTAPSAQKGKVYSARTNLRVYVYVLNKEEDDAWDLAEDVVRWISDLTGRFVVVNMGYRDYLTMGNAIVIDVTSDYVMRFS